MKKIYELRLWQTLVSCKKVKFITESGYDTRLKKMHGSRTFKKSSLKSRHLSFSRSRESINDTVKAGSHV